MEFVWKDLFVEAGDIISCEPGNGEILKPRLYEAIVLRDLFRASLCFPYDDFIGEVLSKFKVEMHKVTPNALSTLAIYSMVLKMRGCRPSTDRFPWFYEMQLTKKYVIDPYSGVEALVQFGSCNFVPRKLAVCHVYSQLTEIRGTLD